MEIKTKYAHTSNYKSGRSGTIQYIVLHYTANNGDTAKNNCTYFQGANRKASANYFVDENSIWQSVKDTDTAWHCGGGLQGSGGHAFYGKCTNSNSIGVEMCNSVNGVPKAVEENALWLVRMLMEKYNVPIERVIRHYDVTGKNCPRPWVQDNAAWLRFKTRIKEEKPMTTAERQEFDGLKNKVIDLATSIQSTQDAIARMQDTINRNPEMIYNYIDENMPEWSKEAVRFFCEKGILVGTGEGLNLSDTKLWVLTILYRTVKFICKVVNIKI